MRCGMWAVLAILGVSLSNNAASARQCAEVVLAGTPSNFDGAPPSDEPGRFSMLVTTSEDAGSPGGPVFVTGQDTYGVLPSSRVMTRRLAADGSPSGLGTWAAFTVPPGAISKAQGVAIASDAEGYEPTRVFVTARFNSTSGGTDIYTAAYNAATGAVIWERTYNSTVNGDDYPVKISYASEWVYVAGVSAGATLTGSSTGPDYTVLRYRASDGATVAPWGSDGFRYNNAPSNGADVLTDMYVEGQVGDPQGGGGVPFGEYLYVTGYSFNSSSKNDYLTARVRLDDPTSYVTIRSQPATSYPTSNDHAVSLDYKSGNSSNPGRIFVTGYSNGNNGVNDDYWTVAYPLDLSSLKWEMWYNGNGEGTDRPVKILFGRCLTSQCAQGLVFVTGSSWGGVGTNYDVATVAYQFSITGAPMDTVSLPWLSLYPGTNGVARFNNGATNGEDRASDLVLDKFANLYICGKSKVGSTFDVLGLSYQQSGDRRWITPPPSPTYTELYHNGAANGSDFGGAVRVTYQGGPVDHDGQVYIYSNTLGYNPAGSTAMRYTLLRYFQTDAACPP